MATPGVPVRPAYAGGPNRDHRAVLGTVGFSHVANQGRRAHDVIDDRFHQMAFQVGCGDEGLVEQLGCIAQHVELAKLRHLQVVGDLEGAGGMLFHEEDGVVLFADPLDGLEDDVDQHWRQTRQGPVGQ